MMLKKFAMQKRSDGDNYMKSIKEYLNEGLIKRQAGMDMRTKIEAWLNEHNVQNYTINDDLTIDYHPEVLHGSKDRFYMVNLQKYNEPELPDYIQFGEVGGTFLVSYSQISSLRGFPKKCLRLCLHRCPNITSLKGCQEVVEDIDVSYCTSLTSLEGLPKKISGSFDCQGCSSLKDLKGAPKVGASFSCEDCYNLESLEDLKLGVIRGSFCCDGCIKIKNLIGSPTECRNYFCRYCKSLESLEGISKRIRGDFYSKGCGKRFTRASAKKWGADVMIGRA